MSFPVPRPPAPPPAARTSRLKSPRVIVPVLLIGAGCVLYLGWVKLAEQVWKPPLLSHLPPDAHDVRFGGSMWLLTVEGVCSFSSSPAGLAGLVSSPGFVDITDELATPEGQWWRAHLDEVARRHLGQSLESLGTVRVHQKNLREINDITEDVVVVETVGRDKALLYYLYQQ